jgi:NAD(P)-dependent dehydrogenase (short-subunit alcohol dehydrogenase family)
MTENQKPLASGFGPRTSAGQVLEGIDLSGRTALVTGGYSGLGLASVEALHAAGADVLVPARNPDKARSALAHLDRVSIAAVDLADLDTVRAYGRQVVAQGRHIDMLIGSAGIMATPETRVGPGWEAQFATNHLGHFVLCNGLWPVLKGGARVVLVSSGAHGISDIRWDDMMFTTGYDKWQAYGQSKTANVLCAVELDRRGAAYGVRAFSLNPGAILTPLQRHLSLDEMMANGWVDEEGRGLDPDFKSPEEGAATQVWAATSPMLDGKGGLYCQDCDVAPLGEAGVRAYAIDGEAAKRLWAVSSELTGADGFGD